jgi:hypothetical protein
MKTSGAGRESGRFAWDTGGVNTSPVPYNSCSRLPCLTPRGCAAPPDVRFVRRNAEYIHEIRDIREIRG